MIATLRTSLLIESMGLVILAGPLPVIAEVSIRLDGVPDRLSFPLPAGSNQVVTATIKGEHVTSIWLGIAESGSTAERVTLLKIDEAEYAVNLASSEVFELLRSRGRDGQFRIFAETSDGTVFSSVAVRYSMQTVPESLDFPFDEARLTIYQRSWKKLPGSNGSLQVYIGDITGGQVPVTVYDPRAYFTVGTTSMKEGDLLSLPLDEQEYVLRLDKLVNHLIGPDYAVFTLLSRQAHEANSIDGLLRFIETAETTFLRNGVEIPGKEFAALLRSKYEFRRQGVTSTEKFIREVATRSSTTGKRYRVRLGDGEVADLDAWLLERAAELDRGRRNDENAAIDREPRPVTAGCRLDLKTLERFLQKIESSRVLFTCKGKDLMTATDFARVQFQFLAMPGATEHCFDEVVEGWASTFDCCEGAYEAKLPDGSVVSMGKWIRQQAEAAVGGKKDDE